jgi:NAD(P)-dependent dehydrogenase (short-subunit alcohol dehydrogenase family)
VVRPSTQPDDTLRAVNRFDYKIALLTGAASGVGRATSIRLASEGASVFGLDVNADGMAETKATIEEAGGTMVTRATDITDVAACRAAVEDCVAEFGGIDIVGNIAGIANQRHVHQVTEDEWDLMNGVNLKGMFFLTQAALPHVLEREGNIINIASNAGLMGQAYTVPYCATKGGVVNMTKALAMEFVKQPIRINAIAPGGIDTPLVHNFEIQSDVDFALMQPYMGFRDASTAEQIAALFAYVASDEAGNIHGSIISADGGLTAS